MSRGKITKRSVDALVCEPGRSKSFVWDTEVKGFGAAVTPKGGKYFCIAYRDPRGKQHRVTIGRYGLMTPEQARSEAKKQLGSLVGGIAPVIRQALPTFGEVAQNFIKISRGCLKEKTIKGYESLLRNHILPRIGSVKICDLKRDEVQKMHLAIPGITANRCVQLVKTIWNDAAAGSEDQYFQWNPTRGIKLRTEKPRRKYMTYADLEALGKALAKAEAGELFYTIDEDGPNAKHGAKPENRRRPIDPYAIAAIRLLVMTGARLTEILHSRWSDIDLEAALVQVPDGKTGWLTLFLTEAAREILSSLPRVEGNDYVIVGDIPGRPRSDLKRPWQAVREEAGLTITLHGLRHSFASFAIRKNISLPLLGQLMNHRSAKTTARYSHLLAEAGVEGVSLVGEIVTPHMRRLGKAA